MHVPSVTITTDDRMCANPVCGRVVVTGMPCNSQSLLGSYMSHAFVSRVTSPCRWGRKARSSATGLQASQAERYRLLPPDHIPDPTKDWLLAKTACRPIRAADDMGGLLGFFAFMRSGELTTTDNTAFDTALHLTPMDIAVDDTRNRSMLKSQVKVLRDADEAGY